MRFIIMIALVLVVQLSRAEVTATVDRTTISEIDLLTLTIRVSNEAVTGEPDFSAISGDFDVVNTATSSSQQISIINGRQSKEITTTYTITLQPTRRGNLTIPQIAVAGWMTNPMTIRVVAPSVAQSVQTSQYVFFDTSVDQPSTYVQSQVIYTLKLFYADTIAGDFPAPPTVADAVVETIEEERRYESVVNNQRYYVLEKRYAIFPQKSGTLTIPAEIFRGTRGRGGLFGTRQSVSTISRPIEIEVKPRPSSFTGDTWLAARSLVLQERWTEQPPVFKVGEPVNRVLSMQATGLAASMLPAFESLQLEGIKTYADPAVTEERADAVGLISSSVTTIGIVPTKSGPITLPAIRIPWWNTETDRQEVAEIPAATYTIVPADSPQTVAPQIMTPLREVQSPASTEVPATNIWMYGTIAVVILWLISTWQWLTVRAAMARQKRTEAPDTRITPPDEPKYFEDLTRACQHHDAAVAHRNLFLWSHARFHTDSIQAFSRQQHNEDLGQAVAELEQALYGSGDPSQWNGDALLNVVKQLRADQPRGRKKRDLVASLNPG